MKIKTIKKPTFIGAEFQMIELEVNGFMKDAPYSERQKEIRRRCAELVKGTHIVLAKAPSTNAPILLKDNVPGLNDARKALIEWIGKDGSVILEVY